MSTGIVVVYAHSDTHQAPNQGIEIMARHWTGGVVGVARRHGGSTLLLTGYTLTYSDPQITSL